jgi:hypothetical protein
VRGPPTRSTTLSQSQLKPEQAAAPEPPESPDILDILERFLFCWNRDPPHLLPSTVAPARDWNGRIAVRIPRHLHDATLGSGQGAATCRWVGRSRNMPARRTAIALLSLLMPVQRAAEQCAWLRQMVDAGEIYHPLRWRLQQAVQFLKNTPVLEAAGVVVRMPAAWRMGRPARPQVKATIGGSAPSELGVDALLDFRMEVTLEGETLSTTEIKRLLAQFDGLAFIRGK